MLYQYRFDMRSDLSSSYLSNPSILGLCLAKPIRINFSLVEQRFSDRPLAAGFVNQSLSWQ